MHSMSDINNQDIRTLRGVGDARARLFAKLGVDTVGALLRFYPRAYEDWASTSNIADACDGNVHTLRVTIATPVAERRVRGGMMIYTCKAYDAQGQMLRITIFNNRYAPKQLVCGEEYLLRGKISLDYGANISAPIIRRADSVKDRRFLPIYRQVEGLSGRVIESTVAQALSLLRRCSDDDEPLPREIREERRLPPLRDALIEVHQPSSEEALYIARRRLCYDELLTLQLALLSRKSRNRQTTGIKIENDYTEKFFSLLPFEPTGAQKRAVADCMRDMLRGSVPMARLLQGDVGSGKTAVAAALCYSLAKCGFQSALMAPTEILAEQHARSLSAMLEESGIQVRLLTGSMTAAEKRAARYELASGFASVAVGTHALISEGVEFSSLALVITDEQHRFGVAQRAALSAKGENPHMLVMSATPIPRTLALMVYGDLDVSVLDELPKGRQSIKTYRIDSAKRQRAYGFIRKHLDEGRQAYIVCPLVEESEVGLEGAPPMLSAQELYAQLTGKNSPFDGCRIGLLHGRMSAKEKDAVMRSFASGETQLLVATTVVEVGVDVPNAVIMLIENAERFGLSQLHQLRGRVGRGSAQSHCILVSDSRGETAQARLSTMVRTSDGFEISAEDLRLRGPGDFFGSRQHGLPELRIADLESDFVLLSQAQEDARLLLEHSGDLAAYPLLAQTVQQMLQSQIVS